MPIFAIPLILENNLSHSSILNIKFFKTPLQQIRCFFFFYLQFRFLLLLMLFKYRLPRFAAVTVHRIVPILAKTVDDSLEPFFDISHFDIFINKSKVVEFSQFTLNINIFASLLIFEKLINFQLKQVNKPLAKRMLMGEIKPKGHDLSPSTYFNIKLLKRFYIPECTIFRKKKHIFFQLLTFNEGSFH